MDTGNKITGGCFGDKGAREDSRYKVLCVFDWKVKRARTGCVQPGYRARIGKILSSKPINALFMRQILQNESFLG